jgi:hypothetical protein
MDILDISEIDCGNAKCIKMLKISSDLHEYNAEPSHSMKQEFPDRLNGHQLLKKYPALHSQLHVKT